MKASTMSICIVTFRQRGEMVRKLVADIRQRVPEDVDIILAINGNNNEDMPDWYRRSMLELCMMHKNVYPIFCPEFKSLSKLWNTLVIFSKTQYNFIICDDVEYGSHEIYQKVLNHINTTEDEFFTINGEFSHFVCTKNMLHKVNYFDERLSAFGEEDGDMHYKHIEATGKRIPSLSIPNIFNKAAYYFRNEKIETFVDNKPKYNREVANLMYVADPNGIVNPMDPTKTPVKKIAENTPQYPHEMFVIKNKHNIEKFEKVIF
jgi:hypothetical protein